MNRPLLIGCCLMLACANAQADESKDDRRKGLAATQKMLIQAAAKASRFVVTIETLGGTAPGGGRLFKRGKRPGRRGGQFHQAIDASTTGLIVGRDGLIVTSAFNFNTKPQIITVILPDGREFVGKLIARDFSKGLALVKIDAKNLKVPQAVQTDKIETGRWAIALGRAYAGKSPSTHFGIISATNRISGKAMQTDAPCSPVNYGGPLIDLNGDVLGVIVPLSPRGSGLAWYDSGIGFAVPLVDIQRDLAFMIKRKTLHGGFLGVQMKAEFDGPGAKIEKVVPKSAAETGGLEAGDIVLKIAGKPILNRFGLLFMVGKRYAGDTIQILIKRDDETFALKITLGRRPAPKKRPPRRPPNRK